MKTWRPRPPKPWILATVLAGLACVVQPAAAADAPGPVIDGRIQPGEWDGATHVTGFRLIQPLSGDPAPAPTEAWYVATPKGLAVAFRNLQPGAFPRTRQHTRRDEDAQVDRVNVMVDFDGDGHQGYDFTVLLGGGIQDATITASGNFSNDWDGEWLHAVSEDNDGWSAEVLIPWHTGTMRKANGDTRTIGLYFDRVIGATGQRMAWPYTTFEKPQFLDHFTRVQLPAYSESLLAITPFARVDYDNVKHRWSQDAGGDVFWKPNGQFQLSATVNPDFGQVESDSLVVNFGAQETFFSDKRPFFTENKSIYDFNLVMDNSQLVYTRRVGGRADDGNGSGDIVGAVKANGSFGKTNYGVMWAQERGDAGRTFLAARAKRAFGTVTAGVMATQVQHPFLDRNARVLGNDYDWHPTDNLSLTANVVGSDIATHGQHVRGEGATLIGQYEMAHGWRQQVIAIHYGDTLDVNDFGYLGRNNLNYAHYELGKRVTDLPASSIYASHNWRWRIDGMNDDHGLSLQREFRVQRNSQLRDGGSQFAQVMLRAPAHDDRLMFGNGVVRTTGAPIWAFEHDAGRRGNWSWSTNTDGSYGGGVDSHRKFARGVGAGLTWYASDLLNFNTSLYGQRDDEWLLWQHDTLLGSFRKDYLELNAAMNWNITPKQELRVKLQAISLQATPRQAWRVQPDGSVLASSDGVPPLALHTLGFQVRYRYELAPLSNIFVVYGRGGQFLDEDNLGVQRHFRDAFRLRDTEQLLIKVNYRFEL